jgi:hypothetical protein
VLFRLRDPRRAMYCEEDEDVQQSADQSQEASRREPVEAEG